MRLKGCTSCNTKLVFDVVRSGVHTPVTAVQAAQRVTGSPCALRRAQKARVQRHGRLAKTEGQALAGSAQ